MQITIIYKEQKMILDELTEQKFGYSPSSLAKKSHKSVCIKCDYCLNEYEQQMKRITIGREYIVKDACIKCKYEKRKDVSMAKYGVSNSSKRTEVRQKISKSNSARLKSASFKTMAKKTNLEKYGHECVMHNKSIADKQRQTLIDRYGEDNPSKVKEIKDRATKAMIRTKIQNGTIKTYEGKTRPEIAKEHGFSRSHFGKLVNRFGMDKAITMIPKESSLETFFEEWLKTTGITYQKQYKLDGYGYIADFKIGDIIVELDGLYWHSDSIVEDRRYHEKKRQAYIDNGYTPLFFREDEVYNKFPIIKSIVSNKLKINSNIIYARKCKITTVNKQFFVDNHLMGKGYGHIFALENQDETVAAIQIRRLKNKDYEISRFCSSLNTNVVGGFSKLVKHVERTLDMDSLKTFIDLRYGTGYYLESLGFTRGKSHLSFKWTNGSDSIHRLKFRGNSGYEKGFFKIWDCGQLPFRKSY